MPDLQPDALKSERKILRDWCARTQKAAKEIESLCDFEGNSSVNGFEELKKSLESLLKRTERPEIRILILGPLKSGKSTLINVLLNNPRLSQISQYPAYPCFIEVRDLARNPDSSPVGSPQAVFIRPDGSQEPPCSLHECRLKLDELLDRYITGKEGQQIEYPRVEQRIDFQQSGRGVDLKGLDLVVVDSPGLFFQRSIDQNVFGLAENADRSPNTAGYSHVTGDLYKESDVAIFVIRWEQLFFHTVAEYLSRFREDVSAHRNLRTFVIVNSSTQSRVQVEDRFEVFDQTAEEHREKQTEYFERHIADDRLIAQLRRRQNISLHFADLLQLAVKTFGGGQGVRPSAATGSEEVMQQIREYIFDHDLPRKKRGELETLLFDTQAQAHKVVSGATRACQTATEQLQREAGELASALGVVLRQIEDLSVACAGLSTKREYLKQVQKTVETRKFEASKDEMVARFTRERSAILNLKYQQPEEAAKARRSCGKIYLAWGKGEFGVRTLKSLAERVWGHPLVLDGVPSLADLHAQARNEMVKEQVRAFRDRFSDQTAGALWEVSSKLDDRHIAQPNGVPGAISAPPLLVFYKRRMLRVLPPAKFWGDKGTRAIMSQADIEILEEKEKELVAQIWGYPWRLSESFEASTLKSSVWKAVEDRVCALWSEQLQAEDRTIESEFNNAQAELSEAVTEKTRLETAIGEKQSQIQEQSRKLQNFNEILERLESMTQVE